MHADMTAITIQSNKIVLNEVKDNWELLAPSYRKKQMKFLDNPVLVIGGDFVVRIVIFENDIVWVIFLALLEMSKWC